MTFEEVIQKKRRELFSFFKIFLEELEKGRTPDPSRCSKKLKEILKNPPEESELILLFEKMIQVLEKALTSDPPPTELVQSLLEKTRCLRDRIDVFRKEILTDHLTGLWNRKALEIFFETSIKPNVYETDFVLCFIDMDRFKEINDRFGHLCGDECLKNFAKEAKEFFKGRDFLCRLSGDEFVFVLTRTLPESARRVMRSFLGTVNQKPLFRNQPSDFKISFSCGLTNILAKDTLEAALERADKALYRAKEKRSEVWLERV